MTEVAGRKGRLHVSDDAGSTWTLVGGVQDMDFTGTMGELEITAHEDGQNRAYIAGKRDIAVSGTLNCEEDDAGQILVHDDFFSTGDGLWGRYRTQEASGAKELEGPIIITEFSKSGPNDDVATTALGFRFSAAPTSTAQ